MPRTVSSAALSAVLAQETDEVFLMLIEIDHADLAVPIRVVGDSEDVTSGGDLYQAFPFEIDLPTEAPDKVPRARLRIDNVGTVINDGEDINVLAKLRELATKPSVTFSVIMKSTPSTIEWGPVALELMGYEATALTIEGDLGRDNFLNRRASQYRFTKALFPGIY